MSAFCFVHSFAEVKKNESATAFFELRGDEEFLQDHFEGFPVMPGVLLLESLKQTAGAVLPEADGGGAARYRLLEADAIRFGQFVKPGSVLKIFARLLKREGAAYSFEGRIDLMNGYSGVAQGKALSANFKLAPAL